MTHHYLLGCLIGGMVLLMGCEDDAGKEVEQTLGLNVPNMRCIACAEYLTEELSHLEGVEPESIECDTDNGMLSLTFQGRSLSPDKIGRFIAKAGYTATLKDGKVFNAVPSAVAALPPECQSHGR